MRRFLSDLLKTRFRKIQTANHTKWTKESKWTSAILPAAKTTGLRLLLWSHYDRGLYTIHTHLFVEVPRRFHNMAYYLDYISLVDSSK